MKNPIHKYKPYIVDRDFLLSSLVAILFLLASLFVNFYAGAYASERASNSVTDIVLSNIRVFDVGWMIAQGAILFWLFVLFLCLYEPRRIPFTAKSIALFVLIRSIFISITHIGPYPTHLLIDSHILSKFSYGEGDLFFSAHTGLPFLMALVFWDHTYLRLFFLASSVIFGVVVLLGHVHYSIDVLAAFFITYSIYHIAVLFFQGDKKLFASGIGQSE